MMVHGMLRAQDLHFSQFFSSPLSTNPANTGFIPDADYRLGIHVRKQYSNIMAIPYKTFSAFGDVQILNNTINNGWMGLGMLLLSDVAGAGNLSSNKIYASIAYHQMLGNSSLLSAGFNLGWANKSINTNNLKFPDQFDGDFFDNTIPTSVVLLNNSVHYFDVQAGLNYAYFPTEDIYINGGYSIHHVNNPKETFFSTNTSSDIIPMRHIGFLNAIVKLNDKVIVKPNLFFTTQARATNFMLGSIFNYNLFENGEKQLIAGLYYRWNDGIVPMAGLQWKEFECIFSYDITRSDLKRYNYGNGAAECSIIKKGFLPSSQPRQSLCPKF
jgi:type IX secretion system PorP/SprF family membrane protein